MVEHLCSFHGLSSLSSPPNSENNKFRAKVLIILYTHKYSTQKTPKKFYFALCFFTFCHLFLPYTPSVYPVSVTFRHTYLIFSAQHPPALSLIPSAFFRSTAKYHPLRNPAWLPPFAAVSLPSLLRQTCFSRAFPKYLKMHLDTQSDTTRRPAEQFPEFPRVNIGFPSFEGGGRGGLYTMILVCD